MIYKRQFWGALILMIGLIFLLGNLDFIDYSARKIIKNLWPIALIVIGIGLIIRSRRRQRTISIEIGNDANIHTAGEHDYFKAFGDHNLDMKNIDLDGMDCSTIFGDQSVNLSGGRLKSGVNRLSISTTFGDITVIIPATMATKAYGSTTFGDLYILEQSSSGISNHLTRQSDNYDSAEEKLFITATATFGSIKIYQA
jgi:predicted membrane protein